MVEAVKEFFQKYATFSGRTARRTYWMTILGLFLLSLCVSIVGGILGGIVGGENNISSLLSGVLSLATLIPSIAIDVRRLHDINKSGWWLFISLVPFVGGIILLVFMCLPSVNEGNNY